MYGLIRKTVALPGQRDPLICALLSGVTDMTGCLSFVVAKDPKNHDAIWICEVWDNEQSYQTALAAPKMQQALLASAPLIADGGEEIVTDPVVVMD